MPTPYKTLIEAASRLDDSDAEVEDPQRLTEAELAAILGPNWPALEQARAALRDKPRVTIRYEVSYCDDRLLYELQWLRNLGRYLGEAALLATKREDPLTAVQLGLDNLELAHAIRSGGLIAYFLVGIAVAGEGLSSLRKVRQQLDAPIRLRLIGELIQWQKDRWPVEQILAHDESWHAITGCPNDLGDLEDHDLSDVLKEERELREAIIEVARFLDAQPKSFHDQLHLNSEHRTLAQLRMLTIDLALRSYHEANGEYPERLTALETILPEGLPLDPYTDVPFIYHRQSDKAFQLYSPGPSGVDHGGTFGFWPAVDAGLADLCLDAGDYAEAEFSLCVPTPRPGFVARSVSTIRRWWKS